jgi:hypothetical protein
MRGPPAFMRLACKGWFRPLRQSEHDLGETKAACQLGHKSGLPVAICHPSLPAPRRRTAAGLPHPQESPCISCLSAGMLGNLSLSCPAAGSIPGKDQQRRETPQGCQDGGLVHPNRTACGVSPA